MVPQIEELPTSPDSCLSYASPHGVWGEAESGFFTARDSGFATARSPSNATKVFAEHDNLAAAASGFVTARAAPGESAEPNWESVCKAASTLPKPHFPAQRPSTISTIRRTSVPNHAVKRIEELNRKIHGHQEMLLTLPKKERRQLKNQIEQMDAEAQMLQRGTALLHYPSRAGIKCSPAADPPRVPSAAVPHTCHSYAVLLLQHVKMGSLACPRFSWRRRK